MKFYPYVMACYLNINFKGCLVEPEVLSEGKEILVLEMCEAAVTFGDYTLPSAEPDIAHAETLVEESQPPLDAFDLLVTQLSQANRTDATAATPAGPQVTPVEARRAYIKGKMLEELALWDSEVKVGRGEIDYIGWWEQNHRNYKVLPKMLPIFFGKPLGRTSVRRTGVKQDASVSPNEIVSSLIV